MANRINIDQNSINTHSSNIANSASTIQLNNLTNIDTESTIAGNDLAQSVYAESQNILSQLITSLENEANKIQTLGNEFKSVDTQLSNMIKKLSAN